MKGLSSFLIALALALPLASCDESAPKAGSASAKPSASTALSTPKAAPSGSARASSPAGPVTLTLLVTADENGWLLPTEEAGKSSGGAAEMLAHWIAEEGHCVGDPCASRTTIALSAGDHWGGPALSSFFGGEPTAAVMARMRYDLSAFGNHELDFGKEQFAKDTTVGKFEYVAANVKATADAKMLDFAPYKLVERAGVKVAVIGLASVSSVQTTMPNRLDGVAIGGYGSALEAAIPKAWADGADAVVVLAHECPDALESTLKPEWNVALVAGAHCPKVLDGKAGSTRLMSAGKRFERYLRAKITIDKSKPQKERVTAVDVALVENTAAKPEPEAAKIIASWKTKLDADLGEGIGFSKSGLDQKGAELGAWLAEGLRSELGADVAIINKSAIRQSLAKGPITKSTVYSLVPFENSAVIVSVDGEALMKNLSNAEAIAAGVQKDGASWKDASGKPLDKAKKYSVAMPDFLYFGGSGFEFEKADPAPVETGMDWRTPIISWTKKQATTDAAPLEAKLPKKK